MNAHNNTSFGIGLDVGGTSLRGGLISSEGEIVGPFLDVHRDNETVPQLISLTKNILKISNDNGFIPSRVGIGIAGMVDTTTQRLAGSPSMPELVGFDLKGYFESIFGYNITINNDANCAAHAEWVVGAGRQYQSGVAMFIGTGIGGAIMLDGHRLSGADSVAGELGHMVLDPEGPLCGCGGRGCLEQLASGAAILRRAGEEIRSGKPSSLRLFTPGRDEISGRDVASAAREGDPLALNCYQVAGTWLGVAIATLANLLNPEVVILGGGVMDAQELFMPYLLASKNRHTMSVQKQRLRIEQAQLGRSAGTIGAFLLAEETLRP